MGYAIRNEVPADHRAVEELTRDAFWDVHVPGADEHYLVHRLRNHPDFIPELDFVAVLDGQIVGSILYSRSRIVDGEGREHPAITFGPLSVLPSQQRRGVGSALVRHSVRAAGEMGHRAAVIFGSPDYYRRFGFRSAKEFGVSILDGRFPAAHQILELVPGGMEGVSGVFAESAAFHYGPAEAAAFDKGFPPRKKHAAPSQKEFQKISGLYL